MFRPARLPLIALIVALAGCAPTASSIPPAAIPPDDYAAATCRQLTLMRAKTERMLIFAGLAQDQQYRDDGSRTFGVPTPMATIFEESRETDVARLKGEALAINTQLLRMNCIAREG